MNSDKSDFLRGLLYFGIIIFCMSLWIKTPDGDPLLYKLLGLFGLSPGIPLGANATLFIYPLIPLIAAFYCLKKVFKYWYSYGSRFKEFSSLLRALPVIIIAVPVLLGSGIMHPSGIDRIYYAGISQKSGLQAVTYYAKDEQLRYEFTGENRRFSYDFSYDLRFVNFGQETVEFSVKFLYESMDGFQEVFLRDEHGEIQTFTLRPRQSTYSKGEFTEHLQATSYSGSGRGGFSVVLVNDDERHSPKGLVKYPPL